MLGSRQKQALYKAGFTWNEINKLDKAVTPTGKPQKIDLSTPAWIAAIEKRSKFATRARVIFAQTHRGLTLNRARYDNIVNMNFKGNIFDWLKLTYKPRKKTDFQAALKARMNYKEKMMKRRFEGV